ncbi:MAG TPA: DUF4231 domain-containing protein [Candidatus Binatia bacterium]|nr:DUF4231 domain-containing protein [Candidatus Binatia bacterium]
MTRIPWRSSNALKRPTAGFGANWKPTSKSTPSRRTPPSSGFKDWFTYRSTCEDLKHEKYLWLAKAGPYASVERPDALLAERIESLVSREHAKWVSTSEQAKDKDKKTDE